MLLASRLALATKANGHEQSCLENFHLNKAEAFCRFTNTTNQVFSMYKQDRR